MNSLDKNILEKIHDRVSSQRGSFYFLELSQGHDRAGLPYKYLYIFNMDGKNITSEIAQKFNYKQSKSKKFNGSLITSGYGFLFFDYIYDKLKREQTNG